MCKYAAEHGHLEVLKWLRANGAPWYKSTCDLATEAGHLEVLKFAHENGCPWSEYTCYLAVHGGGKVLQFLRADGCPWDKEFRRQAEYYVDGDDEMLQLLEWACANGCP